MNLRALIKPMGLCALLTISGFAKTPPQLLQSLPDTLQQYAADRELVFEFTKDKLFHYPKGDFLVLGLYFKKRIKVSSTNVEKVLYHEIGHDIYGSLFEESQYQGVSKSFIKAAIPYFPGFAEILDEKKREYVTIAYKELISDLFHQELFMHPNIRSKIDTVRNKAFSLRVVAEKTNMYQDFFSFIVSKGLPYDDKFIQEVALSEFFARDFASYMVGEANWMHAQYESMRYKRMKLR